MSDGHEGPAGGRRFRLGVLMLWAAVFSALIVNGVAVLWVTESLEAAAVRRDVVELGRSAAVLLHRLDENDRADTAFSCTAGGIGRQVAEGLAPASVAIEGTVALAAAAARAERALEEGMEVVGWTSRRFSGKGELDLFQRAYVALRSDAGDGNLARRSEPSRARSWLKWAAGDLETVFSEGISGFDALCQEEVGNRAAEVRRKIRLATFLRDAAASVARQPDCRLMGLARGELDEPLDYSASVPVVSVDWRMLKRAVPAE